MVLRQYLDSFTNGYKTHSIGDGIIRRYEKPCIEATMELEAAGITSEKWKRLGFADLFLEGILYSVGGMCSYLTGK